MTDRVFVLMTMDCEPALWEVTAHGTQMSDSGPADYDESERSIKGYASIARSWGYPLTLFVHPKVALRQRDVLLDLQAEGACLGLHLHPYKFGDGHYRQDLGAYSAARQAEMLKSAITVWQEALGQRPVYFRGGYCSANDNTYRVLQELGFRGGAISNPGRILPEHCSVWAGAEPYPHRAHLEFRQLRGASEFVEVPVSVDYKRPTTKGAAGERGFEWPYIPGDYDHESIIRHLFERFLDDGFPYPTIYIATHNDQDFSDSGHPSKLKLEHMLRGIARCSEMGLQPVGITVEGLCDSIRLAEHGE